MMILSLVFNTLLVLHLVVALPGGETLEKRDPRDERGSPSNTYCFTPGDSGQPTQSDCIALGTQIYGKLLHLLPWFIWVSHVALQTI